MSDAPQKSYEHILYAAQMVWFSAAETWSRCRSWVNNNSNKSIKLGQEIYFFFLFNLPKANTATSLKSFFGCSAALWPVLTWRQVSARPFSQLRQSFQVAWASTVPVPPSPAWWRLWLWWGDTPASRPRSSPHTSPEARRKGCRCTPPLSGTPAPPPPASRWFCRSCDSTLLQTLALWIGEYHFGISLIRITLNNLVMAILVKVHRNLIPAAIRHGVSGYH